MAGLTIERTGELAIWRLAKPRGNAIDEPLVDALVAACDHAAHDATVRGVLLASAHERLFCPGFDLRALSALDRAGMDAFIRKFAHLLVTLYGFPKPLVAALTGHALAGGCVLSLCADWRVIGPGAQIGFNQGRVGVPLPWTVTALLRASLAPQRLTSIVLLGRNQEGAAAVAAGLADEVHAAEGFEPFCLARLGEFAEKEPTALSLTKRYLRAPTLAAMQQQDQALGAEFLDAWFSPATQARIRAVVASLGRV